MKRKISMLAVVAAATLGVALSASSAFGYGGVTATLSSTTSTCASSGCQITLNATGFQPGETVTLTGSSTPFSLGSTTANSSGDFTVTVSIPSGLSAGTHTITAAGQTSGTTATFTFTVTAAGTSTTLPTTGADIAAYVGIAAVAVALGGLFVMTTRRRRSREQVSTNR